MTSTGSLLSLVLNRIAVMKSAELRNGSWIWAFRAPFERPATATSWPRFRRYSTSPARWVSPPPQFSAELTCRMRIVSNKIREKFGPAERRGSDLADNDARSMIGQCCALFDARSGRVRQTKRGDHGIPGAGHIENFARECRQVVGIHGVEKGHSIFTPRDQCIVTSKFFQQLVPCLLQRCFVGNGRPGEQFRFTLIRSDYRYRPVIVGMLDLRIDEYRHRGTARLRQYAGKNLPADDTLVVVGNDHSGCRGKVPQKPRHDFSRQIRRNRLFAFPICADDLLAMGNDSCLDCGWAVVSNQAGDVDA